MRARGTIGGLKRLIRLTISWRRTLGINFLARTYHGSQHTCAAALLQIANRACPGATFEFQTFPSVTESRLKMGH